MAVCKHLVIEPNADGRFVQHYANVYICTAPRPDASPIPICKPHPYGDRENFCRPLVDRDDCKDCEMREDREAYGQVKD